MDYGHSVHQISVCAILLVGKLEEGVQEQLAYSGGSPE
jgi:hypothetical protein